MGLHAEKLKLIQLLLNTENPSIIEKIKSVFQNSGEQLDLWEELSDRQKEEIENAVNEAMNNLTIDYDHFISHHRK